MEFAGQQIQPAIAGRVTGEQVDAARDTAEQIALQLGNRDRQVAQIRRQIVSLKRRLAFFAVVAALLRIALKIRATSERLRVWRGGALIIGTAIAAALAVIAAAFVTNGGHALIWMGAFGAVIGGALCGALLFLPDRYFMSPRTQELETGMRGAELRKSEIDRECSQLQQQHATAFAEYRRLKGIIESRLNKLLACEFRVLRGIPFEDFLSEVFQELGFEVETTKTTGDQGVDLIAKRPNIRLAIQAKGYVESVGNAAVQQVVAGKMFYGCNACAVITNSEFTSGAIELAARTDCFLIDGSQIHSLIMGQIRIP